MEFCMSIFSPRNFNDIPQSVCVKEVWEGGMRGEKPCYYATRTISTHAIDDFLFPVVPTSFVSLFMAWQAYQAHHHQSKSRDIYREKVFGPISILPITSQRRHPTTCRSSSLLSMLSSHLPEKIAGNSPMGSWH